MDLNRIICGDNIEVLKSFPDDFFDMSIQSPPYDNLRKYLGFSWNFEELAIQLTRVTKPGGVIIWVVGDATINGSETGSSFRQALYFKDSCKLNIHDTMIYASKKPPLTHNRYEQEFEYLFCFSKGKPKTFNPIKVPTLWGGSRADRPKTEKGSASDNRAIRSRDEAPRFVKADKIKGNIFEYKTGGGHSAKESIAFQHPAIFPELLVHDQLISWSNEGDTILDCFNGSGTTTKVAKQLKRNFIGIEVSPEYCQIAEERLKLV